MGFGFSSACACFLALLMVRGGCVEGGPAGAEAALAEFVAEHDAHLLAANRDYMAASWNYYTNITDYNQDIMNQYKLTYSDLEHEGAARARGFDLSGVRNYTLRRMVNKILDVGISACTNRTILDRINELETEMTEIYSLGYWCKTPTDCKMMEPDLVDLMRTSRDYDELAEAWRGWRDVSGKQMRNLYYQYASLKNEAIREDGRYADMGEYYRSWYESPTFEEDVRKLFTELRPLYDQLHAYVRFRLKQHYGTDRFPETGHIPAHLFGNMWAQDWRNIYDLLAPYPGHEKKSLTDEMLAQGYTVDRMFREAEDMFTSLGLGPMPRTFWTRSLLERPEDDRKLVCHASAWDMYDGTDFRIKQCTTVTEDQFTTVQHEMGHVIYYTEYWQQPALFREGANHGFHEGVASLITMSFVTPENLKRLGLIHKLPSGQGRLANKEIVDLVPEGQQDINTLFKVALDAVAFLPFGYLIDQWRWSLYRGNVTQENLNSAWWDLRCGYQGVSPPVERTEEDFDPGAKFHIPGNYPYIRYFVSSVARYQWHDALCQLIGHKGPLHRCNLYGHKTAGKRLREMLRMGSSRPWTAAMRAITRGTSGETDKLSAYSLLKFFKPLQDWLEKENKRNGETIGWNRTACPNVRYGPVPIATAGESTNSAEPSSRAKCNLWSSTLLGYIVFVSVLFVPYRL